MAKVSALCKSWSMKSWPSLSSSVVLPYWLAWLCGETHPYVRLFDCPGFEPDWPGVQEGIQATDDAQLVERLGHRVALVEGSAENIKITRPEDLAIGEAILAARQGQRKM